MPRTLGARHCPETAPRGPQGRARRPRAPALRLQTLTRRTRRAGPGESGLGRRRSPDGFGYPVLVKGRRGRRGGAGCGSCVTRRSLSTRSRSRQRGGGGGVRGSPGVPGAVRRARGGTWRSSCSATARHVIHLGDRDCSVQRRLPEAHRGGGPAPGLDDGLRETATGGRAVALGERLALPRAAGTGSSSSSTPDPPAQAVASFYFLEVKRPASRSSTPVTEAVTGHRHRRRAACPGRGPAAAAEAGGRHPVRPRDRGQAQRRGPGQGLPPRARATVTRAVFPATTFSAGFPATAGSAGTPVPPRPPPPGAEGLPTATPPRRRRPRPQTPATPPDAGPDADAAIALQAPTPRDGRTGAGDAGGRPGSTRTCRPGRRLPALLRLAARQGDRAGHRPRPRALAALRGGA